MGASGLGKTLQKLKYQIKYNEYINLSTYFASGEHLFSSTEKRRPAVVFTSEESVINVKCINLKIFSSDVEHKLHFVY